ncbi:MAG: MotA/TolQ/ExbB proton channel family protein [Hyphomicrobiales bacterium]
MFENFDWIQAMRNSPIMVVILFLSVMTAGFAIERAIYFWKRRGNADSLLASAMVAVRSGNNDEAVRLLASSPHPMGPVAAEAVRNLGEPDHVAEEKLHIALSEQRLELERNLGFLGTMGNTAPLIGLLGTVWGIMRAFHDMARTGSAGPSVVAAGVAEALFTTAAGLLVAVPAVLIYNNYVRRMGVMLTVAENHARTIRLGGIQSNQNKNATSRAA